MENNEEHGVLILVLVEHTLREPVWRENVSRGVRLNPCFSGTYSQRAGRDAYAARLAVLILVLVEHTLRVVVMLFVVGNMCLNPCFSGTYSQSVFL